MAQRELTFIDFFSGVGMFRKGMELAGHKCIGYCEIESKARQTYELNYDTTDEWVSTDVMALRGSDIPVSDVWCFGFPCKDMSFANFRRTGLAGKQSGLFLTMCSLLEEITLTDRPEFLFIENVKGFVTIHGGYDFLRALCILDELEYDVKFELSSAIEYGVPQNRIRTYLVCHKRLRHQRNKRFNIVDLDSRLGKKNIVMDRLNIHEVLNYLNTNFYQCGNESKAPTLIWGKSGVVLSGGNYVPRELGLGQREPALLRDILQPDDEVEEKYFLSEEQLEKIRYMKGRKERVLPDGRLWKEGAVPFPDRVDKNARCVTPSDGTLNRSTHVIATERGYRKLTIRERARLQGLPDDFQFNVSDSAASLQLGNGVCVQVIKEICEREINPYIRDLSTTTKIGDLFTFGYQPYKVIETNFEYGEYVHTLVSLNDPTRQKRLTDYEIGLHMD